MQKWHAVGSWHWIMNETGALVPLSLKQYLGGRWSTTYKFAASFFSDSKDFTKKKSQQLQNEIKETKHRVDHLSDEILGICDSLLFDFLSDQCCWGPPHRRVSHVSWRLPPALHLVRWSLRFYRMDLRMTGVFLDLVSAVQMHLTFRLHFPCLFFSIGWLVYHLKWWRWLEMGFLSG